MKFKAPKGTHDVLPWPMPAWESMERAVRPVSVRGWQRLERIVRSVMDRFGYEEIRTPAFEETALFARSVGETTDIVKKEMYTFADKKGRSLTLRPEGTAPVARSYVEHSLGFRKDLVKLFYVGPMFRYEQPQAGRFRQFHQIGAEAIGSPNPDVDVDVILLLQRILEEAGLAGLSVSVNSVGDAVCRPARVEAVRAALAPYREELCPDCRERLERNPLRILDCKVERCRELARLIPRGLELLCGPCREHFDAVVSGLARLGVAHRIDTGIVRGLDYYTRTAFEVHHDALGSQTAIGGGGRYDGLVEEVGGKPTPGIGFAAGIERILALLGERPEEGEPRIAFIPLDPAAERALLPAVYDARRFARAELIGGAGALGKKLRTADAMGARFAVIVGEQESAAGRATIKDLKTGTQTEVAEPELLATLRQRADEAREAG